MSDELKSQSDMVEPDTESKKAAIDLDDIQEKALDQVTAADFLNALNNSGVRGAVVMRVWPEKKKFELLLEPEFSRGITIGKLFDRLGEKKKTELEKPLSSEILKRVGAEGEWIDPRRLAVDPVEIAREIVRQLKPRGDVFDPDPDGSPALIGTESKRAAIDLDDIQEKALDQVTAADFLNALNNSGVRGAIVMRAWPEKKKFELLLEPEFSRGITIGKLFDRLGEKKKTELEKPLSSEILKRVGAEGEWIDRRVSEPDPDGSPVIAVEIAREVVRQLKGG